MSKQPCSYCALPTTIRETETGKADIYCCLGCRIAAGIMQNDDQSEWTITRLGMAIFFTMNVMVFTLVLWTWNVHDIEPNPRIIAFRGILRYACLLFSTPVVFLLAGPLVESSVESWRERRLTTDVLLLLGVVAAFGYSVASLYLDSPDVYFEVCCMILVAVTLGKWLEGTAKQKATNAIRSLRDLLPSTVRVLKEQGDVAISIDEVAVGDLIRVLPGERIPLDGQVQSKTCVVDEQLITGESIPVTKYKSDTVFAGSLNLSHELELVTVSAANDGTIARLVNAVEEAASTSCRTVRLADRLAAWFVPLIMMASVATFVLHLSDGTQNSLMAAISVVLIACPCALGIATPMAIWVAINSAARRGVLFRNGDAVMELAKVRSLGLDKTGTVTTGNAEVISLLKSECAADSEIQSVALRLASSSNHPLACAIADSLRDVESNRDVSGVEDHPGRGITAVMSSPNGQTTSMLGSHDFAASLGFSVPPELMEAMNRPEAQRHAAVCVGWDHEVRAVFLLGDTIRTDSLNTIAELKQLGLSLTILTGDTESRAAAMQETAGLTAIGRLLPEDKARELTTMQGPVGMVGDGLNDALALSTADVGIAMDCGADVSRESADVCLLGSTLAQLPWAIQLSRATHRTVRRNLVWAVGYNVIGIGFAMTGRLNPIIAAIAMVGSSLFVLTSSLALGVTYGTSVETATLPSPENMNALNASIEGAGPTSQLETEAVA